MKTQAIVPAELDFNADGIPCSAAYGDIHHPAWGAAVQANHVFVGGSDLPRRWQGRDSFVSLEPGFGLGSNFVATWNAWRHDPSACQRLHFISIESSPLRGDALRSLWRDPSYSALADELADQWPALTPNLHHLSFEGGRVHLLLALGDVAHWMTQLTAGVDACYLDGFAPAKNPLMWQPRLFKAMGRMAAPNATVATWTASRAVREGLGAAGFEVRLANGVGGKRDITLAGFAPAFVPRRAPSRSTAPSGPSQHAMIIGAGLAGCATAWALADQGWTSTVLDRHATPAQEASGNPAGLFHGIVNPQDGAHARFNRAAALQAERVVSRALREAGVAGDVHGLLRLDDEPGGVDAMRAILAQTGLPPDYVRAVDANEASELAGIALTQPAWFYPGGGWVDPAGLARAFVDWAGNMTSFRGGANVHRLQRVDGRWRALDADSRMLSEANVVVLANAGDAIRLMGEAAGPMQTVTGQLSIAAQGLVGTLPRLPVAGAGYLLPALNGTAIFGATAQPGDAGITPRDEDHAYNLAQLRRLTGRSLEVDIGSFNARVGLRSSTDDRLPIIGAVPDLDASAVATRLDQPRFVPRVPGAFVFTALGSRGITWCALGARTVAAGIVGTPSPLEADLLDAVDAGRFVSRQARRRMRP